MFSLNEENARKVLEWKYETPYDFYNNELSESALREFLENDYYAIKQKDQELIGFFCTGAAAQVPIGREFGAYNRHLLDIGLGMNPELTGKGRGSTFLAFILEVIHGQMNIEQKPLRLTVATFNKRAIRLYEKYGFKKASEFMAGSTPFMTMERSFNA